VPKLRFPHPNIQPAAEYSLLDLHTTLLWCLIYYIRRRLFVCLSVCLLATYVKTTKCIFTKIFTADVTVLKEEQIKFWKSSTSGSASRNFWRILQHCQIRHFLQFGLYLRREWLDFSWKFCILGQRSPRCILEVIRILSLDPDTDFESRPDSPWRRYAVS